VLLDLKESAPDRLRDLVAELAGSLPDRQRYVVCAVDPEPLADARAAGFATWRTARDRRELARLLADGRLPDEAVSIRHSLLDAVRIEQLHAAAPLVVAWTVNDRSRARMLRGLGVDGVTTDRTAVLRELA
jgi:glycerophosphoryl diester phosphodiesterase